MDDNSDGPSVKSIARAATVLHVLADMGADGGALTEIARRSGFGKATTHRILAALSDVGFAYQNVATRQYHLGAKLGLLSRRASQHDIGSLAQPVLARLAAETGDTVYIQVREGLRSMCIGREQGSFPIRTLSLDVGQSRPLGVGSGSLALLAFLPQEEIDAIIAANARWLKDYPRFTGEELRALVSSTRKRGYAFIEGQIIPGVNAIAVPVFDAQKHPFASLSVTAIADRIHGERALKLASMLREEAEQLAAAFDRER
ncbi:IclR family transcriptional regulator [Pseudochelatococcus sp. B33]